MNCLLRVDVDQTWSIVPLMTFIGLPTSTSSTDGDAPTIRRRASCLRSSQGDIRWNAVRSDLLQLSSVAGMWYLSVLDVRCLRLASGLLLMLLLLLLLLCLAWPLCRIVRHAERNIQTPINILGNGFNLRSEFLFNSIQIEPVLVCNKIDGKT